MMIIGYKGVPDWKKVKESFKKCTDMQPTDIEKIVKSVKSGKAEPIPNDFVLYEDLKELGLLVT